MEDRRTAARVILFYKAVKGLVAITIPAYVQHTTRLTRHYHPLRYIQVGPALDSYKYSFIPRTVVNWNALPPDILNLNDADSFKLAVQRHFYQM